MSEIFRDSRVSRVPRSGVSTLTTNIVRILGCILTTLSVAGCSSEKMQEYRMGNAFDELMKRPNLTVVEADYQSMYQTIQGRLVAEVGVSAWVPDAEPIGGSACAGDLSHLEDARERLYSPGMSPGNLPDAKWDQAVAIVTQVAGHHGFAAPQVIVSGPSDHEVEFRDQYNGYLVFGTGYNTILFGGTGCHLTEKAHQRGSYLPPEKY
jgi:hypothetical protein